nr:STAS domain-containing protein [Halalkalibacter urbisdiaboli]
MVKSGREPLVIPNLLESDLTKDLAVTKHYGGGCLIGVPIFLRNGTKYGTLCGMDNKPFTFTEEHIELFKTMASLITYVLQVDIAYQHIHQLSVPIVRLSEKISILPIIGEIDEERAQLILEEALRKSQDFDLDYLIIDLSGISKLDQTISTYLIQFVLALNLIGVTPLISGFRPEMAAIIVDDKLTMPDVKTFVTVKQALSSIGLSLKE